MICLFCALFETPISKQEFDDTERLKIRSTQNEDFVKTTTQVGPAADGYKLTVGGFNDALSTLGDSMAYNNGEKFSTK